MRSSRFALLEDNFDVLTCIVHVCFSFFLSQIKRGVVIFHKSVFLRQTFLFSSFRLLTCASVVSNSVTHSRGIQINFFVNSTLQLS
jgi:hypothetical protein